MTSDFEYRARPGNLALSATAFGVLVLLTAFLWQSVPGLVLLLLIPALCVCFWQIVVTPVYGLHLSPECWHIFEGPRDRSLPARSIAHLRVCDADGPTQCTIVMTDGTEVKLHHMAMPDPTVLIREATNRGVPVREG